MAFDLVAPLKKGTSFIGMTWNERLDRSRSRPLFISQLQLCTSARQPWQTLPEPGRKSWHVPDLSTRHGPKKSERGRHHSRPQHDESLPARLLEGEAPSLRIELARPHPQRS